MRSLFCLVSMVTMIQWRCGVVMLSLSSLLVCAEVGAASGTSSYDPSLDPGAALQAALARAETENKQVMLVFGAEWCGDCRYFSKKIRQSPLRETVEAAFVTVYVDIGNWDHNMGFAAKFPEVVDVGIPSIAIVDASGHVQYISKQGVFIAMKAAAAPNLSRYFEALLDQLDPMPGDRAVSH